MPVPILKQGDLLIASVQSALSDQDWQSMREKLLEQVGTHRTHGVILDVTPLDVIDSFATRTLNAIAQAVRLCGAQTVLAGIQPDVALSMVQLGLASRLVQIDTALDLEDALARLVAEHAKGNHDRDP